MAAFSTGSAATATNLVHIVRRVSPSDSFIQVHGLVMRRATFLMICCVISVCGAGCCSIRSTFLERDQLNVSWQKRKLNGYPITLKLPTHMKVEIISRSYLSPQGDVLTADGRPVTTFNFRTQLVETEKLFTVDYLRPASGALEYDTRFTPDGYIGSLRYSANDDAITQTSLAIQRLVTNVTTGTAGPPAQPVALPKGLHGDPAADLQVRKSPGPFPVLSPTATDEKHKDPDNSHTIVENVVASGLFALDDPDVEMQIAAFVQQHCRS
jgi:hypothetical protein